MIFNSLAIRLINTILGSNSGSLRLLTKHSGKTFKVSFPGFPLAAAIDIDGYLMESTQNNYSVEINIPANSAVFLLDKDKLALYKKLKFKGNAEFGREVLEVLSKLHLDNIYTRATSPITMLLLNKLSELIKGVINYIQLMSSNFGTSAKEYLLYESRELVSTFEHDKFCDEVDQLLSSTEQFEQRLQAYIRQNQPMQSAVKQ